MLYIINEGNTNKYKIGKTNNIKKRISQLQCGNSNDLYIFLLCKTKDDNYYEIQLHEIFKEYSIRGEWFEFKNIQNIINYIKKINEIKITYEFN